MRLLKSTRKKISKRTECEYRLCCDNGEYSIECVEYTWSGTVSDRARIDKITRDHEKANRLFTAVAENGVCACTLFDIVVDFLC